METKSPNPVTFIHTRTLSPVLQAYLEISHLKQLYRQGWLKRGVPKDQCESVADHSFGTAILAILTAATYYPELDISRVGMLAITHELGEVYAGDITPDDGIAPDKKISLERDAVNRISNKLPNGYKLKELWDEYADGRTPEAKFVHQIDRLEMAIQAGIYQAENFGEMLEFFESAKASVKDAKLLELIAEAENFKTK